MELFWALVLLAIAGAASLVDVVRHSRANPEEKIPWLGNPPRLPKWWILPRLVMIFTVMAGIHLLWRGTDISPWITGVVPVVAIVVPALCVLIAHNRRVKDVATSPALGRQIPPSNGVE
ncbi:MULTISPECIES: hypothetical protein [unclassified Pseudoclavibacter]|uniref:hypothetical protein n=1 Tax=unclassified Pseudoclavibacter TaxID=2615177 RepID=UPI001BA4D6D5|nr:hypothetical protein [Pseudoclavibacter sp. Marseille-Q4354]MBS3179595.1 hypothetical protein [Pseudoclavibacter sp. Marseille-Q4354]